MGARNRVDTASDTGESSFRLALRVAIALGAGSAAGLIGYAFASFAGHCVLCAAGRSPTSLGTVLGIAAAAATWALLQVSRKSEKA
jgi:hypothetical protein